MLHLRKKYMMQIFFPDRDCSNQTTNESQDQHSISVLALPKIEDLASKTLAREDRTGICGVPTMYQACRLNCLLKDMDNSGF